MAGVLDDKAATIGLRRADLKPDEMAILLKDAGFENAEILKYLDDQFGSFANTDEIAKLLRSEDGMVSGALGWFGQGRTQKIRSRFRPQTPQTTPDELLRELNRRVDLGNNQERIEMMALIDAGYDKDTIRRVMEGRYGDRYVNRKYSEVFDEAFTQLERNSSIERQRLSRALRSAEPPGRFDVTPERELAARNLVERQRSSLAAGAGGRKAGRVPLDQMPANDFERYKVAEDILGGKPTGEQWRLIDEAHAVAADRHGAGYGKYTREELQDKLEILRDARNSDGSRVFTKDQVDQLLARGVAGRQPNGVRAALGGNAPAPVFQVDNYHFRSGDVAEVNFEGRRINVVINNESSSYPGHVSAVMPDGSKRAFHPDVLRESAVRPPAPARSAVTPGQGFNVGGRHFEKGQPVVADGGVQGVILHESRSNPGMVTIRTADGQKIAYEPDRLVMGASDQVARPVVPQAQAPARRVASSPVAPNAPPTRGMAELSPDLANVREGDRITLVSVRGNQRQGTFHGIDEHGNILFKQDGETGIRPYYRNQLNVDSTAALRRQQDVAQAAASSPRFNVGGQDWQRGQKVTVELNGRRVTAEVLKPSGSHPGNIVVRGPDGNKYRYPAREVGLASDQRLAETFQVGGESFRRGQKVTVELDGRNVEVIIVNPSTNFPGQIAVRAPDGHKYAYYPDQMRGRAPPRAGQVATPVTRADMSSLNSELAAIQSGDRITLVSVRGNQRRGTFHGFDERGNILFRQDGEAQIRPYFRNQLNVNDTVRRNRTAQRNLAGVHPDLRGVEVGQPITLVSKRGNQRHGIFHGIDEQGNIRFQQDGSNEVNRYFRESLDTSATARANSTATTPSARSIASQASGHADNVSPTPFIRNRVSELQRRTGQLESAQVGINEVRYKGFRFVQGGDRVRFTHRVSDVEYARRAGRVFDDVSPTSLPPGNYTYVITKDGRMSFGRVDDGLEFGVKHMHIADGRPVVMGGELKVGADGSLIYNELSGTYTMGIMRENSPGYGRGMQRMAQGIFEDAAGDASKVRRTSESVFPNVRPSSEEYRNLCRFLSAGSVEDQSRYNLLRGQGVCQ
jgi:biotin-(acetyl-CoA carboxylase) ligase